MSLSTPTSHILSPRKILTVILAGFLSLIGGSIAYNAWGHRIIRSIYEGRSFDFLNNLLQGRNSHPLQFYLELGDRLMLLTGVAFATVVLLALMFMVTRRDFAWPAVRRWLDDEASVIEGLTEPQIKASIFLASGLSLFIELMIIRIHSSYFQLFAYVKNVSLLSCFLGLGIGFYRGNRSSLCLPSVIPFFSLQIMFLFALRHTLLSRMLQNPLSEQLTLGLAQARDLESVFFVYLFVLFVFLFNALCFIPLGQVQSRLMSKMLPLPAYGWNLLGSLAGISGFTFLSFLWTPPFIWIIIAFVPFLLLFHKGRTGRFAALISLLLVLVFLSLPGRQNKFELYSPYQILSLALAPDRPPTLETSNVYYQRIIDFGEAKEDTSARIRYYFIPYRAKPYPDRVLIVGSGTGNDVTAAILSGARQIDAVEIDPAVLKFGMQLHPQQPYRSDRVRVIVDDARAFLRNTRKQYDLIVYGLLDAHTLLSGRSGGIRLDSYVYTVEGFLDARRRLKEHGLISLTFCVISPALGKKLYLMLQEAFNGEPPRVYLGGHDGGVTFLAGPGLKTAVLPDTTVFREITDSLALSTVPADKSTDDWPFFYMPSKRYPMSSVFLVGTLLIFSFLAIRRFGQRGEGKFSAPCFFLGAGFMLVETKGITELALVYGSTWVVNSAIISAILMMAFLANSAVIKVPHPRLDLVYGLLFLALGAGLWVTFLTPGRLPELGMKIVMPLILTLPVFFSGVVFSMAIQKTASISSALSSNLLGAMLGGFLEYNSMCFGFRSLYLLAMGMYALAFLTSFRQWSAK